MTIVVQEGAQEDIWAFRVFEASCMYTVANCTVLRKSIKIEIKS